MPYNPSLSRPVTGLVDPELKRRMAKIRKAKPRLTESWQIKEALEKNTPLLEKACGFKSAQ